MTYSGALRNYYVNPTTNTVISGSVHDHIYVGVRNLRKYIHFNYELLCSL